MRRWALLLLMLAAALFASCKDATQVSVVLRTNVPYASGAGVALWSSRSGVTTAPLVESADPWLGDGEVGDVVVTPGDASKDSALTIRVAMGLRGKRAAECTDEGDVTGCIIARRKLAFVPHARLKVPVVLYLACEGVKCTADTTCSYLGQCVPAQVDPAACATADGCSLPGEPPFVPGVTVDAGDAANEVGAGGDDAAKEAGADGGDAANEAGPDAGVDGSADTGTDAGAGPTGPELASGGSQSCARFGDGSVKCWGVNSSGQLGLGDTQSRGDGPGEMGASLPTVDLGPGRTALQITAGGSHVCARLDDGSVKCWGANGNGQLGLGDTQSRGDGPGEMGVSLPAVDLGPGRTALQVSAGGAHTCARLDDGSVKCWGLNGNGNGLLGLGDTQDRGDGPGEMGANLPTVDLGPGRTALQVTAGNAHVCARLDDGSVKCWGGNGNGLLGLGDTQNRGDGPGEMGASLPTVALGPGRTALQVAAAFFHTCARLDDGSVKCWGGNPFGQLGLGDLQSRGDGPGEMGANLPAVDLGPGRMALQITAVGSHTCALLDNGSVKCWGINNLGQLGLGDAQARGAGPGEMGANLPAVDLGPGRTALQLTSGFGHTCTRLDDGTVKCWGNNGNGQLGLGDAQARGDGPGEMGAALPVVQLK
jgi:alpha-tubulin suppressor-like RCC1 family protein